MKCCICGEEITDYGNNPAGAMWKTETGEIEKPEFAEEDRCCDKCNTLYVIPGRLYSLRQQKIIESD